MAFVGSVAASLDRASGGRSTVIRARPKTRRSRSSSRGPQRSRTCRPDRRSRSLRLVSSDSAPCGGSGSARHVQCHDRVAELGLIGDTDRLRGVQARDVSQPDAGQIGERSDGRGKRRRRIADVRAKTDIRTDRGPGHAASLAYRRVLSSAAMRDVAEPSFDAILASHLPTFSEPDAVAVADRTFGVAALTATNLGSERDQTFLLEGVGGERLAIMKVSNAAEDPATLDMEALAVLHARRADPDPPRRPAAGRPRRRPGAGRRRRLPDHVRGARRHRTSSALYDVLPGHGRSDPLAAERRGDRRLGGDDGSPRPRDPWLHPPEGPSDDALGHPARSHDPIDAAGHPRRPTPRGRGRSPRPVRGARGPALADPARPVRPRGLHDRQRARGRRRADHRHRRLRRHEPLGARGRPRIGHRFAGEWAGRRRTVPGLAPGPRRLPARSRRSSRSNSTSWPSSSRPGRR